MGSLTLSGVIDHYGTLSPRMDRINQIDPFSFESTVLDFLQSRPDLLLPISISLGRSPIWHIFLLQSFFSLTARTYPRRLGHKRVQRREISACFRSF
jgi:hypothetical protein